MAQSLCWMVERLKMLSRAAQLRRQVFSQLSRACKLRRNLFSRLLRAYCLPSPSFQHSSHKSQIHLSTHFLPSTHHSMDPPGSEPKKRGRPRRAREELTEAEVLRQDRNARFYASRKSRCVHILFAFSLFPFTP